MRNDLIKEYCPDLKRYIIRERRYGSPLSKFLDYFKEAQKDFPELTAENVEIKQYGGQRYARTFGIEWMSELPKPEGYYEVSNTEYTL